MGEIRAICDGNKLEIIATQNREIKVHMKYTLLGATHLLEEIVYGETLGEMIFTKNL